MPSNNEEMIRLWNDGNSASSIASSMGLNSRNVVIGRINRLADKGDLRITRLPASRPTNTARPRIIPKTPRLDIAPKNDRPVRPAPDTSQQISLLDIPKNRCRYIVSEPEDMICCGQPGHPYCEFHRSLCYTRVPGTPEDRAKSLAASRNSGSMRQFGG